MSNTRPSPQDITHLLRLVRGESVPEEQDEGLGEPARGYAHILRTATNGVAPFEALARSLNDRPASEGDEILQALLAGGTEKDSAGPIGIEVSTETNFEWRTAREIASATPERIDWIVPGFVAKGAITEIDAKIKVGKTEFIARMVKAVLEGDDFLGRSTRQTPIVYLTEQSETTFREPLRRAGLLERDDLVVLSWHKTIGHPWETVAAAAIAKCQNVGADLLIVDGFSQFAGLVGEEENSSGKAGEAMRPIQIAAGVHGLAVAMLRHDRKSGGDVGDSARGSSAFGGAVDIILALRRGDGNTRPSIRALHGLSRFDETPTQLMIELTAAGYVALGSESAVAAKEARIAILDSAPESEEHAVTEQDLYERAGAVKRSTARPALLELVANGALQTVGEGKRGDPKRYWRASGPRILSVGTTGVPTETIVTSRPTVGDEDAPVSPKKLSAGTSISIGPAEIPAAFPAETKPGPAVDPKDPLPW